MYSAYFTQNKSCRIECSSFREGRFVVNRGLENEIIIARSKLYQKDISEEGSELYKIIKVDSCDCYYEMILNSTNNSNSEEKFNEEILVGRIIRIEESYYVMRMSYKSNEDYYLDVEVHRIE
ncbi:hypothetical protein [Parvicella tangerina]|uniref:hypothetical protein n=1 Tax=Parvicella tangerina TaxID=2829795 RepID=UPI00215D25E9|nr:hypothetical protein [Parvicella tangerina]